MADDISSGRITLFLKDVKVNSLDKETEMSTV